MTSEKNNGLFLLHSAWAPFCPPTRVPIAIGRGGGIRKISFFTLCPADTSLKFTCIAFAKLQTLTLKLQTLALKLQRQRAAACGAKPNGRGIKGVE